MPYTVTIGGVDVGSTLLRPGKVGAIVTIEDALNGGSRATISVRQATTGTLVDSVDCGDVVEITDDTTGSLIFGGQVGAITTEQVTHNPSGTYYTVHHLACTDWATYLRRRLVNAAYRGDTLADIVADINTNYLAGDGFDVTNVTDVTVVSRAAFGQVSVASAFDTLAKMTGLSWWVNAGREVYFEERSAAPTILAFDASSRPYRSIKRSRSLRDYTNVVVQKGGLGTTATRTEAFVGDGTRRVFNVAYPVATKPTITLNAVAVAGSDVGIRGLDTGKKWYWSKGSTEIEQDLAETQLTSSDDLEVTYTGQYPIIVQAEDAVAIAERAAASPGTSGRYEIALSDFSVEDLTEAAEKAAGHLGRYGSLYPVVVFVIDGEYVYPGAMVSITLPELALTGLYLIEKVAWADRGDGELRATVTCVGGMARDSWESWWRQQSGTASDVATDAFITQLQATHALLSLTVTEAASSVTRSSRILMYAADATGVYCLHEYGYQVPLRYAVDVTGDYAVDATGDLAEAA